MTNSSTLLDRLDAVRRTVRRRLLAYGVFSVAAGGAAAFLTIVTLDYLLHLPPVLRLTVGGLFFAGFVVATLYWVARPLQAPLDVADVAARLEARFQSFDDRLLSAVDFLRHRDAGSAGMVRQVVRAAEELLTELPVATALSRRPVFLRGTIMAGCFALLGAVIVALPDWTRTGLYRYAHPFGEIEWPRRVSIVPLTGGRVVAVGDSVTIRMQVRRGLTDTLRGLLCLQEPDGRVTKLAMKREPDGVFYATVDALTTDLTYWFEAGDDTTRRNAATLRAVPRPEVVSATATVEPPDYALDREPRTFDLSDGPVNAAVGGAVRLHVRASKPIPVDGDSRRAGLRTEAGEWIPLAPDPHEPAMLTSRFTVLSDLRFRIELRDRFDLENRSAGWHTLRAAQDRPPVVTVLEPSGLIETTARGRLPLRVRVEDDFGVTRVVLEATVNERHATATTLSQRPPTVRRGDRLEALLEQIWSVAEVHVSPGDRLDLTVTAFDSRPTPDGSGQAGRSVPVRVQIISDAQFDAHVRAELVQMEGHVREAALTQAQLHERAAALRARSEPSPPLSVAQRDEAVAVAVRQGLLARRVQELGRRLEDLARRVEQNLPEELDVSGQIGSIAGLLEQSAEGAVTRAGQLLVQTHGIEDPAEQQQHVRAAVEQQQSAMDALQIALRQLAQWGGFQEILGRARDLLDRQERLRVATAVLSRQLLGKQLEALTSEERAGLGAAARRQEQLGTDIARLLDRMRALAAASQSKDGGTGDALDAALRAASAFDLPNQLDRAVTAIRENRSAQAGMTQKTVSDVLRRMVRAMAEQQQRQLEELRKRLADAADLVAELIRRQQDVLRATQETALLGGAPSDVWQALHANQHSLASDAELTADELIQQERTVVAGRLVGEAGSIMRDALRYLTQRDAPPAVAAQESALGLLEDALAALQQEARRAEEEWLRRSLAQIRENLAAMLSAQGEVNRGVVELVAAVSDSGRMGRLEARAAARLARRQEEVRQTADDHLGDFARVPAYHWAVQRITRWMTESRTALAARRLSAELVELTERIARELEKLIDAIDATQALPLDTQFVETEGGGGDGEGSSVKPVPTVAELLLLKALQDELNERTVRLHAEMDPIHASEAQLRQMRALAEDQAELGRLTERVTRSAREP